MDPTECNLDDEGKPHCSVCGGSAIESSRHLSHFDLTTGAPVAIDRVWGHCRQCKAVGWWKAERPQTGSRRR